MRSLRNRIIATVAFAIAATGLFAGTASAGTFSLGLTPPPSAIVGQPTIMHATGVVPQADLPYLYYFSLDAISTSVMTRCPADRWEAVQVAQGTGGSVITLAQSLKFGPDGAFSIALGITPSAPGDVLLCGYIDDGEARTLDAASMVLHISPAGSAAPAQPAQPAGPAQPAQPAQPAAPATARSAPRAKPTPASIAREVRSAARSCRALLAGRGARSCVRRAVRKGNAACRRLPRKRARTACLRGVKRAAKA